MRVPDQANERHHLGLDQTSLKRSALMALRKKQVASLSVRGTEVSDSQRTEPKPQTAQKLVLLRLTK